MEKTRTPGGQFQFDYLIMPIPVLRMVPVVVPGAVPMPMPMLVPEFLPIPVPFVVPDNKGMPVAQKVPLIVENVPDIPAPPPPSMPPIPPPPPIAEAAPQKAAPEPAKPAAAPMAAPVEAAAPLEAQKIAEKPPAPPAEQPATEGAAGPPTPVMPLPEAGNAPNFPIKIVVVNKEGESVKLQNVGGDPIDLGGWKVKSIRSNQEHTGIGGMLAPQETRDFLNASGMSIWSKHERNDGALYSPHGDLISYWYDQ